MQTERYLGAGAGGEEAVLSWAGSGSKRGQQREAQRRTQQKFVRVSLHLLSLTPTLNFLSLCSETGITTVEDSYRRSIGMGAQGVLDACLLICCRSGCGVSSSEPCVCEPPLLCPPACGLCVLPLPLNYQILECKETYTHHPCCPMAQPCIQQVNNIFFLEIPLQTAKQ